MTDRIARRPHGRQARETYGAADVHSFTWPPVLEALEARPGRPPARRRLRRRRLHAGTRASATGCDVDGVDHSRDMVRLAGTGGVVHGRGGRSCRSRTASFTAVSSIVAFFFFPDRCARCARCAASSTPSRPARDLHDRAGGEGDEAAPYPLATRGHFYTDDELAPSPREAGFVGAPGRPPRRVGSAPRRATLTARRAVQALVEAWHALSSPARADHDLERRDRPHRRRDGARVLRRRRRWPGRKWLPDRPTRGIEIGRDGDGVTIDLHVVVEYGLNLAEVASTIRNRVGYEVERLTGLPVRAVEVHIDDVRRTG